MLNKAAVIERCVARAREELARDPDTFDTDYTRQDAAILNVQRACEAALDMGHHLIRREKLGLPQSSRDVFSLLVEHGWIDDSLGIALKRMVGFRNIAVHAYQQLHLAIVRAVITDHLPALLTFSQLMVRRGSR